MAPHSGDGHLKAPASPQKQNDETAPTPTNTGTDSTAASTSRRFFPRGLSYKLLSHKSDPETVTATATMFTSSASSGPNPDWDAYPGFYHRDKSKQRAAISSFLADKIRNDWEFVWPQPRAGRRKPTTSQASSKSQEGEESATSQVECEASFGNPAEAGVAKAIEPTEEVVGEPGEASIDGILEPLALMEESQTKPDLLTSEAADSEDNDDGDALSFYSSMSEDESRFCYRTEWASELSEDEMPEQRRRPDTPDSPAVRSERAKAAEKKAIRRREQRKEALWNDGLACFEARRNAWTGARTVRIRCRPTSPPPRPPLSPRRIFFRSSTPTSNPGSPAGAETPPTLMPSVSTASSGLDQILARDSSQMSSPAPVEVVLPVPPRLLPPSVMLKWNVSSQHYAHIYDTVIVESRTPTLPINLGVILKSCVVGWKRDNEWPPKPAQPVQSSARSQASQNAASSTRPRRRSFMQIVAGRGATESNGSRNGGWSKLMMNIGVTQGNDEGNSRT